MAEPIPGFGHSTPTTLVIQAQSRLTPGDLAAVVPAHNAERKRLEQPGFETPALQDLRDVWLRAKKADETLPDYFGDWGEIAPWCYLEQAERFMQWKNEELDADMLRRHSVGRRRPAGPQEKPYITILHGEYFCSSERLKSATDLLAKLKWSDLGEILILYPLIRDLNDFEKCLSRLGIPTQIVVDAGWGAPDGGGLPQKGVLSGEHDGSVKEIDVYFGLPEGA